MKTLVVKVDPRHPDKGVIALCGMLVRRGGIVAFPTETVYGLAVNLLDKGAVERLYRVKRRSRGKPLTVHIAGESAIGAMGCSVTPRARRMISKYWPGPLTVILKARGGGKTGFRMPANAVARELIAASGVPVAAPSANLSGKRPPVTARDVLKDLDGKIDLVIDGGRTRVGIESTVVDLTDDPPTVLREGAIAGRSLAALLGKK